MILKCYLAPGKKEATIRVCFYVDKIRQFKVHTQFKIEQKYWDKTHQRARKRMKGSESFNNTLELFKLGLLEKIRLTELDELKDWDQLKFIMKEYIKTGKYSNGKSIIFTAGINKFIEVRKYEYKPGTVRKYEILKTLILHFEEKYKVEMSTDNIDYSLVEKFRQYVLYDRENRNDTAYRMIAALKCVVRWLIKNGYNIDPGALKVSQPVKNKYDIVTLSEDEIKQIEFADLSIEQQRVRDCFLFQIYTGQRFSDMQQLSPDQIKGHIWEFRSVKTGKLMYVPFVGWSAEAKRIAEKYNYRFPQYTSQYFNRALKLICRNAKINTVVRLTRYRGSQEIIIEKPKYQLISSHTARRTAVSLLLAKGVPPTIVMKLTGHTDIKTMMKYERTTTEALEASLKQIFG
jgi:site-specific recombinase XerD